MAAPPNCRAAGAYVRRLHARAHRVCTGYHARAHVTWPSAPLTAAARARRRQTHGRGEAAQGARALLPGPPGPHPGGGKRAGHVRVALPAGGPGGHALRRRLVFGGAPRLPPAPRAPASHAAVAVHAVRPAAVKVRALRRARTFTAVALMCSGAVCCLSRTGTPGLHRLCARVHTRGGVRGIKYSATQVSWQAQVPARLSLCTAGHHDAHAIGVRALLACVHACVHVCVHVCACLCACQCACM